MHLQNRNRYFGAANSHVLCAGAVSAFIAMFLIGCSGKPASDQPTSRKQQDSYYPVLHAASELEKTQKVINNLLETETTEFDVDLDVSPGLLGAGFGESLTPGTSAVSGSKAANSIDVIESSDALESDAANQWQGTRLASPFRDEDL